MLLCLEFCLCLCNHASIPLPTVFLPCIRKYYVWHMPHLPFRSFFSMGHLLASYTQFCLLGNFQLIRIYKNSVFIAENVKNSRGYDLLLHTICFFTIAVEFWGPFSVISFVSVFIFLSYISSANSSEHFGFLCQDQEWKLVPQFKIGFHFSVQYFSAVKDRFLCVWDGRLTFAQPIPPLNFLVS